MNSCAALDVTGSGYLRRAMVAQWIPEVIGPRFVFVSFRFIAWQQIQMDRTSKNSFPLQNNDDFKAERASPLPELPLKNLSGLLYFFQIEEMLTS